MGTNCCSKQSEEGIEILRPEKVISHNNSRNYQRNNENNLSDPFSYDLIQKENQNFDPKYNDFSNQENHENQEKEKQDQQKKYSNYEYSQISQKQEDITTPLNYSVNQFQDKNPKNTIRSTADITGNEHEINKFEDLRKIEDIKKNEDVEKIDNVTKIEDVKQAESDKRIESVKKIEENNISDKEPENKKLEKKENPELFIDNKQEITINNENKTKTILRAQNRPQIQEQKKILTQNENNIIYTEIPNTYQQEQTQQIYATTQNLDNIIYPNIINKPITYYDVQSQILPHISQISSNDLYTENKNTIIETEPIIKSQPDYLLKNDTEIDNITYYQNPCYETTQEILTNNQIIPYNENNYLINKYTPCENIIQNDLLLYNSNPQTVYSTTEPIYDQSTVIPINLAAEYDLQNCYFDDSQLLNSQAYVQDINNIYKLSTENYINYQTEPGIQYKQSPQKNEITEYQNPENNLYYSQNSIPIKNNYEFIAPESLDFQKKTPITKKQDLFSEDCYNSMTFQEPEKIFNDDNFNLALPNIINKSKLKFIPTQKYNHTRTLSDMDNISYKNSKSLSSYKKPLLYSKNTHQSEILSE